MQIYIQVFLRKSVTGSLAEKRLFFLQKELKDRSTPTAIYICLQTKRWRRNRSTPTVWPSPGTWLYCNQKIMYGSFTKDTSFPTQRLPMPFCLCLLARSFCLLFNGHVLLLLISHDLCLLIGHVLLSVV